jgi:flavodoxin
MKTLIIYTSLHHGNTEKVARAMAAAVHADIVEAKNVKPQLLEKYDLLGFGSGIYNLNFHRHVLDIIARLPKSKHRKAFVFSTSSFGLKYFNRKAARALRKQGIPVTGSFACRGFFEFRPLRFFRGIAKGRPNERDVKNAEAFVRKLAMPDTASPSANQSANENTRR